MYMSGTEVLGLTTNSVCAAVGFLGNDNTKLFNVSCPLGVSNQKAILWWLFGLDLINIKISNFIALPQNGL